jgi:hypothetical protein
VACRKLGISFAEPGGNPSCDWLKDPPFRPLPQDVDTVDVAPSPALQHVLSARRLNLHQHQQYFSSTSCININTNDIFLQNPAPTIHQHQSYGKKGPILMDNDIVQ